METILDKIELMIANGEYLSLAIYPMFLILTIVVYLLMRDKKTVDISIDKNIQTFENTFDISSDAIMLLSPTNDILYANRAMINVLHLGEDFLSKPIANMPEVKVSNGWQKLDELIKSNEKRLVDKSLFMPQSVIKTKESGKLSAHIFLDTMSTGLKEKKLSHIVSIQDLTKDIEIAKKQYNNKLTELPNEIKAVQDLPALYSKVHINDNKVALLLIDLDGFTKLRSVIGYEEANSIIINFANYLKNVYSRFNLKVYHTADNHFLLTLSDVNSIDEINNFIDTMRKDTATFYNTHNMNLHFSFSVGISMYPDSGEIRQLLDNVYKALIQAQDEGTGRSYLFVPDDRVQKYNELSLQNDMKIGLEKGEFEVYYQPIVAVESRETVAAEALIRWNHPKHGMIPPDIFISLMERTGFIIKLGRFILDSVVKQQKRWEVFDFKPIEVSINVSMVEIATGDFVQHIEETFQKYKMNPKFIKFEITEGMAMIGEKETKEYFNDLKKLGVGLSLDDFGTGYTSFTYLKKFPADVIKIDKSLIDHILTSVEDQGIVKGMIELGHNLGMKVVIEGVENEKMVDMLASFGADYIQGYFFDKPRQVFEFQKHLKPNTEEVFEAPTPTQDENVESDEDISPLEDVALEDGEEFLMLH